MALCPTCHTEIGRWTDDPILTPKGLSGEEYIGFIEPRGKHIIELQDRCKVYENDYNVLPRTEFSEITPNSTKVCFQHIIQLRESTEKISQAMAIFTGHDLSIQALLYNYFNHDENGNYITSEAGDKYDWTESIIHKTRIKAIHIEDLRHPFFQYVPQTPEQPAENCYIKLAYFKRSGFYWEYGTEEDSPPPHGYDVTIYRERGFTCPIGVENACLGTYLKINVCDHRYGCEIVDTEWHPNYEIDYCDIPPGSLFYSGDRLKYLKYDVNQGAWTTVCAFYIP